jgi:hypothetical protein
MKEIFSYHKSEKTKFKRLLIIEKNIKYPVSISANLKKLVANTKKDLKKNIKII